MVLIISQDQDDQSTNDIIDWLSYYKVDFYRLNGIEFLEDIEIQISSNNEVLISVGDYRIDLQSISYVWIRRWYSHQNLFSINSSYKELLNNSLIDKLRKFCNEENKTLHRFILKFFNKKSFNNNQLEELNKLEVLSYASLCGLNIPKTRIITSLNNDLKVNKSNYIVKAIGNAPSIEYKGGLYKGYTSLLEETDDIEYFPSLIQQKISKKYEIRSFYLNGEIFSMAIMSQSNKETSIDFRVYDIKIPTRWVPYKLPKDVAANLTNLFLMLNLKCGSVDFIYGLDDEYYFLEINQEGQFGMVSFPCNYYLEEKLARAISAKEN